MIERADDPPGPPMPRAVCPDCRQGKHGACVGDAWDADRDKPAVCECYERNHKEQL